VGLPKGFDYLTQKYVISSGLPLDDDYPSDESEIEDEADEDFLESQRRTGMLMTTLTKKVTTAVRSDLCI